MKRIILPLLVLLFGLAADAKTTTRNYTLRNSFNTVNVSGNVEVDFTPSSTVNILGSADSRWIDSLKIRLVNNALEISFNPGREARGDASEAKVVLSCPVPESVIVQGNSEFDCQGSIDINSINLVCSGNGSMDFEHTVSSPSINAVSSGNAKSTSKR